MVLICIVLYSHCDLNLHFPDDYLHSASFHVPVGHLHVLFEEMSIQVFCPFFEWVVCFDAVMSQKLFINFEH